jgi:serine/threonine-protein kinase
MPPEQARGRWNDVGPRTDIWALGATMFTALTGHLVHEAETVNELLLAAMTKPAPPLASLLPDVPVTVSAVVDRALAHEMDARWPDARTMQSMVRMAFQSLGDPGGTGRWVSPLRMANGAPAAAAATPELPPQPNPAARAPVAAFGGMMAGPLIAPPLGSVPLPGAAPYPMADPRPSPGWNPGMIADPITGSHRVSGMVGEPSTGAHRVPALMGDPNAASRQSFPQLGYAGAQPPPPQFASGGFSRAATVPMPQSSATPLHAGQPTPPRAAAPKATTTYAALIIVAVGLLLLVIGLALVFVLRRPGAPDPASSTPPPELSASAAPTAAPTAADSAAAPTASVAAIEPAPTASASAAAPVKAPTKVRKPVVTVKKR